MQVAMQPKTLRNLYSSRFPATPTHKMNANGLSALQGDFDILVLGDHDTGKLLVVMRYIHNNFIEGIDSTVEDLYLKMLEIDGQYHEISIYDALAALDLYLSLRIQQIVNCSGLMLVFLVALAALLAETEETYNRVVALRAKRGKTNVPVVIIGNKLDLGYREVEYKDAKAFADSVGASYIEVSAKTGQNVDAAFKPLVDHCLQQKMERPEPARHTTTNSVPRRASMKSIRKQQVRDPAPSLTKEPSALRTYTKNALAPEPGCCIIM